MPRKYQRKRKTKKTLAKKVATIQKTLRIRKPEAKYYDVASTSNVIDNLPSYSITPYRQITQGTLDFANRIGDKVRVSSLHLKNTFLLTGVYPTRVRLFAFIYKQNPDSINSTWSTVVNLYLSSTYMNSVSAVSAFKDYDNRGSFVTIYDKTRMIQPNGENINAGMVWDTILKIPKNHQEITFYAGTSAVTKNELFIGYLQDYDTNLTVNTHYRYTWIDV